MSDRSDVACAKCGRRQRPGEKCRGCGESLSGALPWGDAFAQVEACGTATLGERSRQAKLAGEVTLSLGRFETVLLKLGVKG